MSEKELENAAKAFGEELAGPHPGRELGAFGEPVWHRTLVASQRGFLAGADWQHRQDWTALYIYQCLQEAVSALKPGESIQLDQAYWNKLRRGGALAK